jgi:hypothetical protein
MPRRRVWLAGAAIAFARSERGQRLIADARRKYDTPANRAKLSEALGKLRNPPPRGSS